MRYGFNRRLPHPLPNHIAMNAPNVKIRTCSTRAVLTFIVGGLGHRLFAALIRYSHVVFTPNYQKIDNVGR